MKIPRKLRNKMYQQHVARITAGMTSPHRIRLICTGRGNKVHAPSTLTDIWIDRDTGQFVADDGGSLNLQNSSVPHERRQAYLSFSPAVDESDDTMAAYRTLMTMMAEHGLAPSHGADRIYCHRCKLDIQRKTDQLRELYLKLVERKYDTFDVQQLVT